jgi:hemerythrin
MELRRWIEQHYKNKDKGITQMGNTTTQQYNNKIKELPR